jgi:hypothetical protein
MPLADQLLKSRLPLFNIFIDAYCFGDKQVVSRMFGRPEADGCISFSALISLRRVQERVPRMGVTNSSA